MENEKKIKTIVVNLLGAAGSGKSTLACEVFSKLKKAGVRCEYVDEYAKHLVYEKNFNRLSNQLYVFAQQFLSQDLIRDQVDVIITDSPLLLSLFYNKKKTEINKVSDDLFQDLVLQCYTTFDNLNYFLIRDHEYKQEGRYQDEKQARIDEKDLANQIKGLNVDCKFMKSTENCADVVIKDVFNRIKHYENMLKNGLEIERKFLVAKLPEELSKCKKEAIIQGYIVKNENEVRGRNVDNKKFYLTEKYGHGISREEFEKEITKEDFSKFMKQAGDCAVEKFRYYVPLENGLTAELDVFGGKNLGLKMVEVEFPSLERAMEFEAPDWFGKEVTHDKKYTNISLAKKFSTDGKNSGGEKTVSTGKPAGDFSVV